MEIGRPLRRIEEPEEEPLHLPREEPEPARQGERVLPEPDREYAPAR